MRPLHLPGHSVPPCRLHRTPDFLKIARLCGAARPSKFLAALQAPGDPPFVDAPPSPPDGGTPSAPDGADATTQPAAAVVAVPTEARPDPTSDAADSDPGAADAEDVETRVLVVLRNGPATAHGIAAALSAADPDLLGERVGSLLPLLLELRRRGATSAQWLDRGEGRRLVHALGASPRREGDATPSGAPEPSPFPPPRAFRTAADRAASRLGFAPRLAEAVRIEALHLLADQAAALRANGAPPRDAERHALRAFGDPWRVGLDLGRVACGRAAWPFPRSAWEGLRAALAHDGPVLAAILAIIVFARVEVIGAYHIPSKSMEPTLRGDKRTGDRILVLKWAGAPERFDIVVFDGWRDERTHFVKRCVGLPGEEVRLLEGDLWIDGRLVRKDGAHYEAMLFPFFDLAAERERARRPGADGIDERLKSLFAWEGGDGWRLYESGDFESQVTRTASEPAVLWWDGRIRDDAVDPATLDLIESGSDDACDLRVAFDVTPRDANARLVLRLSRGAARFDAVLRGDRPGVALLVDGEEIARRDDLDVPPGRTTRVRFSQVDHVLRLEVGDAPVLRHDLPEPVRPKRGSPAGDLRFRIEAGGARVRPLRFERDVHWTSDYEALDRGRLGPDEYFMLGDNSQNSEDSRKKGPVNARRIVGKPMLVVWPFSRLRVPR